MGTPEFSTTILSQLVGWSLGDVVAVYTQPDKPHGRGMKITPSPVKKLAQTLGINVYQPENFKNKKACEEFINLKPDILVVAAYGLILPEIILNAPKIAPINVHASILPKYRGAAPIQRVIIDSWNFDNPVTGVSIMRMEPSLDTGPIYSTSVVPILKMNSGELTNELAHAGAKLLIRTLNEIVSEKKQPIPQNESDATYAKKILKNDGIINWSLSVKQIDALIRGVTPQPGARTQIYCKKTDRPINILITEGYISNINKLESYTFGNIYKFTDKVGIICKDGIYIINKLRPEGRKDMNGIDFFNGYKPQNVILNA